MEETIKKDKTGSKKEFESLLSKDLDGRKLKENTIVEGIVTSVTKKHVYVDINAKAEGAISVDEFKFTKTLDTIKVGSKIPCLLEKLENKFGEIVVSYEKAKVRDSWDKMARAAEEKTEISGQIVGRVKGGFAVSVDGFLAFLPGSQLHTKPLSEYEISALMKERHNFSVERVDRRRMNVILSRKKVLEKSLNANRLKEIAKIKEGDIIENCTCKSITSWGAFFSYGNLELLVHINECAWNRISSPSEILEVGTTSYRVKVIKIEGTRISGSLKRLFPDPFVEAAKKYKPGMIVEGVVTSIRDFGAFCNIEPSLTGLIHSTECDHLKSNIHPGKVLAVSQKIKVQILSLSVEERKLSLSYKNTFPSPWIAFKEKYKENSIVSCRIKNKTEFALFLTIEDTPITGMAHINDLTHDIEKKEEVLNKHSKNDVVKCKIIEIQDKDMKVRLSLKALEKNPYDYFLNMKVNSIITCTVDSVNSKGILVYAGNNKSLKIQIKTSDLSKEEKFQKSRFTPGMRVDCMLTEVKPDQNKIKLSIAAAEKAIAKEMLKKYGSEGVGTGQVLGDVLNLREALTKSNKKKDKKDK